VAKPSTLGTRILANAVAVLRGGAEIIGLNRVRQEQTGSIGPAANRRSNPEENAEVLVEK
jgi:hypothetical protein